MAMDFHSVLFVTAAFGLSSFADNLKAPEFTLGLSEEGAITASAPDGHHFNTEAPIYLEQEGLRARVKPETATREKVVFPRIQPPKSDKPAQLFVSIYIC